MKKSSFVKKWVMGYEETKTVDDLMRDVLQNML